MSCRKSGSLKARHSTNSTILQGITETVNKEEVKNVKSKAGQREKRLTNVISTGKSKERKLPAA